MDSGAFQPIPSSSGRLFPQSRTQYLLSLGSDPPDRRYPSAQHQAQGGRSRCRKKGSQRSWTRWLDLVLMPTSGTLATQFIRSGLTPKSRLIGPLLRPGGGLKPPNRLPGGGQAGLAAVLEEESAAADVAFGMEASSIFQELS